jgi:hypothetical protein
VTLATLSELGNEAGRMFRLSVAPVAGGHQPRPLVPGTEEFAFPWLKRWHQEWHDWKPCDVACYSVLDAVVSGAGNVWIADRLVTSPEVIALSYGRTWVTTV